MIETRTRPERLDLLAADDPRDVIHRAVACLAQGGVVAMPSESGCVLAGGALCVKAVERLRATADGPLSIALRGAGELDDWVRDASPIARRLSRRAWPGPVTLLLDGDLATGLVGSLPAAVRASLAPDRTIHLRMPSHGALREVCELLSGPLVLADAPTPDSTVAAGVEFLDTLDVDMILDEGDTDLGGRNSLVSISSEGWALDSRGALSEVDILRMTATIILFVCTGNTCRSPMAEALCRLWLASRLRCAPDEIERRGYAVASAGLAASCGARAASDAAAVVQARGGSLQDHSSRQLTPALVTSADLIVAMTRDHLDAILDEHPEVADRARLLHPRGDDVPDPIGCDRVTYIRTADSIQAHLAVLLDEFLARQ